MHILRKWLIIQGQKANSTRSRKRANLRTVTLWTLWDHTHTGQSQRISILARHHQRHESKVKDCMICQENAPSQTKEIMQSHEVPIGPWIKLGTDLFEHNKRQYILIVEYFSKFPFIHKLHSLSTGTVINELKGLFSENGIPEVIISDGGRQFRSEFRNFTQKWGLQHIQSSPYHHQSKGEAE